MRIAKAWIAEVGASKMGRVHLTLLGCGVLVLGIAAAALPIVAAATPAAEQAPPGAPEAATTEATGKKPGPTKKSSNSAKVLEITTIEGQLLFPKVLFISAEDPARYSQLLHRNYLESALDLGRDVPRPKTIVIPTVLHPAEDVSASAAASPPNATKTSTPNPPEVKP